MVCDGPLQLKLFHDPNTGSGVGFFPQKKSQYKAQTLLSSVSQLLTRADGEQAVKTSTGRQHQPEGSDHV